MNVIRALSHACPDCALILFTTGLLLIYVELNRPGWILPGAVGLLFTLLSISSILQFNFRPSAVLVIGVAAAVFASGLVRRISVSISVAAAIALASGFVYLVRGPADIRIHVFAALPCSIILAIITPLLTAMARRARRNKRGKLI